ncbi:MAG: hypothetical protein O3C27_07890 [Actinomycetota bacterium]|nr:hypothetical protein [Actinomycetota bacterium]
MTTRPGDLRDSDPESYWNDFERRWTGLLSYRYLGRSHRRFDRQASEDGPDTMRLRHDMRNQTGGVMAAPLCIAAPEAGGFSDIDAVPNPVIASLQIVDPATDVAEIEIIREQLRTGRTMGFSRTRIVDANDPARLLAISEGMGVDIGPAPPGGFGAVDNPPIEVEDSPDMPPLHVVFGAWRDDRGTWSLPELSDDLASPDAALHLGPIHVLAEAAATDAANRISREPLQITGWHVMFMARGKVGPFVMSCDASSSIDRGGSVGVRWTLRDVGNDDRPVTAGTALFRKAQR